eukprot:TRINITY_DN6756_c0_g3_i1.p1 TRINITY_DN6756_c0_g3~~TRINITY_DN6756_c0_g3_i1.p1  ORF type:complete len:378 (+),score=93.02 TRINITY_DN6756_c0_g3_i1:58-1191(+)
MKNKSSVRLASRAPVQGGHFPLPLDIGILISEMPISDDSLESQKDKEEETTDRLSKMVEEEAEEKFERRRQEMAARLGIKGAKGASKPVRSVQTVSQVSQKTRPQSKVVPTVSVVSLAESGKAPDENSVSKEIKEIDNLLKMRKVQSQKARLKGETAVRTVRPKFLVEGKFKPLPSNSNATTKADVNAIPLTILKEFTLKRIANIKNTGNSTMRPLHANIHERSEAWLTERSRKIEGRQKEKEEKAVEGCTFEPSLKKPLLKNIRVVKGSFHERNSRWMDKRVATIRKKQADAESQKLLPCTFAPCVRSSSHMTSNDPGSFYLRNVQWKENVAEKTAKKVPFAKRVKRNIICRCLRTEEHCVQGKWIQAETTIRLTL